MKKPRGTHLCRICHWRDRPWERQCNPPRESVRCVTLCDMYDRIGTVREGGR